MPWKYEKLIFPKLSRIKVTGRGFNRSNNFFAVLAVNVLTFQGEYTDSIRGEILQYNGAMDVGAL